MFDCDDWWECTACFRVWREFSMFVVGTRKLIITASLMWIWWLVWATAWCIIIIIKFYRIAIYCRQSRLVAIKKKKSADETFAEEKIKNVLQSTRNNTHNDHSWQLFSCYVFQNKNRTYIAFRVCSNYKTFIYVFFSIKTFIIK